MMQVNPLDALHIFRALSVDKRLRLMQILSERTFCVGALSKLLGVSAGAISQHLRVLKHAGLVEPHRRGYFIHYRLATGVAERCRSAIKTLFGANRGGEPCTWGNEAGTDEQLDSPTAGCPAERIPKCHGDIKKHRCATKGRKRKRKP